MLDAKLVLDALVCPLENRPKGLNARSFVIYGLLEWQRPMPEREGPHHTSFPGFSATLESRRLPERVVA